MSGITAIDFADADHRAPNDALGEARECLAYWEDRADSLPVTARRRRREAREMTARWQTRTAQAERDVYGAGLIGAVAMVAAERRLPAPTRRVGRDFVHRTKQVVLVVVVALLALLMAGAVAVYEVLQAFLQALTQAPI